MWKFITNTTSSNVEDLMKIKIIKASNTNGLKQRVLNIVGRDCLNREFNRFEVLNALNAISRTKFYLREVQGVEPKRAFKYIAFREIQGVMNDDMYKMQYLQGNLILDLY